MEFLTLQPIKLTIFNPNQSYFFIGASFQHNREICLIKKVINKRQMYNESIPFVLQQTIQKQKSHTLLAFVFSDCSRDNKYSGSRGVIFWLAPHSTPRLLGITEDEKKIQTNCLRKYIYQKQ